MFNDLKDEQVGKLIKNCYRYQNDMEIVEMDQLENMLFKHTILPVLNFNTAKYIDKCERNKEVGKKGGRPKKEETQNDHERIGEILTEQPLYT